MTIMYETMNGLAFQPGCCLLPIHMAEAVFRQAYLTFENTSLLDELRATEYARLDEQEQVYLDYTVGGLYAESQLREHLELLQRNMFGNPHSTNPTSQAMTSLIEHTRDSVPEYFNASPDEYIVIFTTNATAALKLVGESYPFAPGGHYLLTADNHNLVIGIREFARAKGAPFSYVPIEPPNLRVNEAHLLSALEQAHPAQQNLFAYPAQSKIAMPRKKRPTPGASLCAAAAFAIPACVRLP